MKFAYADPPYLYAAQRTYGVKAAAYDELETHIALIQHLHRAFPDGWALSMNPSNLTDLARHFPPGARVCSWIKTNPTPLHTEIRYTWEPLILWRGHRRPQVDVLNDSLICSTYNGHKLRGSKPKAFNRWVLALLGYEPGDDVTDLFPGTGGLSIELAQGRMTFPQVDERKTTVDA